MRQNNIDLSKSVYELCKDNPELPELLYEIGFSDITKPGMLASVGRFMTIGKGAAVKKLDLEEIKDYLRNKGYNVN